MTKFFTRFVLSFVCTALGFYLHAQAIITQWNFNSNPADANNSTGSSIASIGVGTINAIGGSVSSFASGTSGNGSSDPVTIDNTGFGITTFPTQNTNNKTAGIQFSASTVGYNSISVTFDLRHSNTGPRHLQFQYTTDVTASTPVWVDFAVEVTTAGDTWFPRSFNLSSITGLNNNPNAGFRVVAAFDPAGTSYLASNPSSNYATGGTWRFDMVTIKGNSIAGDVTAPIAQNMRFLSATTSFIKFSEALNNASATNLANYSFNPALSVSSASLSLTGDTVFLTHAPYINGQPYTLTISGVQDVSLNSMSSTPLNTIFNASIPNLVITEIMHSPNDIEMVEVHNAGTTPINVGGLKWAEGTGGNFPEISLAAGSSIVFSTAPTTASTAFNNIPVYLLTAGLSSSNDILVIRNSLDQTIDSVAYFVGTNEWPTAPNGVYGYSFELSSISSDNNLGSNWVVPQNPIIPQPTGGVVRATPGIYPTPSFTPTNANVSFVGGKVTVNENGTSTLNIIANLQGGGALPSSIDIALIPIGTATNNQDFTLPSSLKFEWPANANNVNDTIAITINNDALQEPTEYFMFRFVNPTNIVLPAASVNHFTVFIQDDDLQTLTPSNSIQLNHIASFNNGTAGTNSAEIVAHDPVSQRLFIVNSIGRKLDIVNFSNPAAASIIKSISVTPYGNINSLAVKNGIVAVALENLDPQLPGKVLFLNTNGDSLNTVTVGAMPDMITFNHAGTKVFTANEGEPNAAYTNDPEGSVSIIDISSGVANVTNTNVSTASFNAFNSQLAALKNAGIRIFGLNATVAQDIEPEYITISDDDATAWITCQENNAIAVLNIATATITELIPLGTKNHALLGNALDASDQGTDIQIANWPVKGLYMPDAIASYKVGGQTYLVTANEGDSREYTGFSEIDRLSSVGYKLDSTAFPFADVIKANIGRLNITKASGDTDGDGDFDEIHVYGSRSFSIWNANTGVLVWDSKDEIEQIIAKHPTWKSLFNASNANNTLKNRSDDKGPEPEGVTIAQIAGKTFAFIALERIGGCLVYDITDPTNPVYVEYKNTRNTASYGGDNGAEGILFIKASDSPTGNDLVILANEVSSTLTFYSVNATALDIQLAEITAKAIGNKNIVQWNTVAEEKGDVFEVERSANGISFGKIATIVAKGIASNYIFTDEQPVKGTNFYRLRLQHNSGNVTYSNIVSAHQNTASLAVTVAPNPFVNQFFIQINTSLSTENAIVEMFDAKGVLVKKMILKANQSRIDASNLPKGNYTVKYTNGNFTETVLVQKQ